MLTVLGKLHCKSLVINYLPVGVTIMPFEFVKKLEAQKKAAAAHEVIAQADDVIAQADDVIAQADDVIAPVDDVIAQADDVIAQEIDVIAQEIEVIAPVDEDVAPAIEVVAPVDEVVAPVQGQTLVNNLIGFFNGILPSNQATNHANIVAPVLFQAPVGAGVAHQQQPTVLDRVMLGNNTGGTTNPVNAPLLAAIQEAAARRQTPN
jgi:hypothetical protein